LILGLTGGFCAGKNAVADLLETKGFLCFDIDKLGHEALALEESMEAIAWRFGPGILRGDGSLDKKALADLVFDDDEGLADLEAIIHPAVYRLLRPRMKAALAAGREVCINAALLYRMPDAASCDAILEVRAPLRLRLRRGRERDGLSPREVRARIRKQASFWTLRKACGRPVFYVENRGSREDLARELERSLAALRSRLGKI
jgi:dephospho-CoA kinase